MKSITYDIIVKDKSEEPIVPKQKGEYYHEELQRQVDFLKAKMDDTQYRQSEYVSHEDMEPIRKIVFGMTTLVLTSVIGALVALVIQT